MSAELREQRSQKRAKERAGFGQYDESTAQVELIGHLVEALEDIREAIDELAMTQPLPMPEECRDRTCSYVKHYLAMGPKELEHEGFHVAEGRARVAQDEIEEHYKTHEKCTADGHPCSTLERLEKTATRWETRIRA